MGKGELDKTHREMLVLGLSLMLQSEEERNGGTGVFKLSHGHWKMMGLWHCLGWEGP